MKEMNQLTEFEKEQIRVCKNHIKNAKSKYDREWWQEMYNVYVNSLKNDHNKRIDL